MIILVVASHPDDEIYAAGLLAKYADDGHSVYILMTTRGEGASLGDPPVCTRAELGTIREQEARAAAAIIGAHEVLFLPYIDPLFDNGMLHAINVPLETFSQSLQQVFTSLAPDILITHGTDGEFGHPQHIYTNLAVFHALKQMRPWQPQKVLTWSAAHPKAQLKYGTNTSDPADLIVDIRPWAERKLKAFQAHRTQFHDIEKKRLANNLPVAELECEAYHLVFTASRRIRIMPLGDSLTEGGAPNSPDASYRGYLENMLRQYGRPVEFVGTQRGPAHGFGGIQAHEGHGGFTIGPDQSRFPGETNTANLHDHIEYYFSVEPDIVLLMIGINDLHPFDWRPVLPHRAPEKLKNLVNRINILNPNGRIFLASLAPVQHTDGRDWPEFQAINRMSAQIAAELSNVYFVDMNSAMEAVIDRQSDYVDDLHFTENGAQKIAQVWFDALMYHQAQLSVGTLGFNVVSQKAS